MIQKLVEFVLKNLVESGADIFGKNGHFLSFKPSDATLFERYDGYNSTVLAGHIIYERDGQTHSSESLILKLSPQVIIFNQFNEIAFFNEMFFYTRIVPFFQSVRQITHLFPKYYDGVLHCSEMTKHQILILENLQVHGYCSLKKKSFLDYDHLAIMMRKLGEFHAYSYYMKEKNPHLFTRLSNCFLETNCMILQFLESDMIRRSAARSLKPLINDTKYASKVDTLRNLIKKGVGIMHDVLVNDKDNPISVLCHGDFLATNIMFKYDEGKPSDLKIIDMASCRIASPIVDLVQVLYLNADQNLRDAHWDDLMNEYYTTLKNTFPCAQVPSKDAILNDFKYKAMLAFCVASYFLTQNIALDNQLPGYMDLLPSEYKSTPFELIPEEIWIGITNTIGGDLASNTLSDILKDMINREFI